MTGDGPWISYNGPCHLLFLCTAFLHNSTGEIGERANSGILSIGRYGRFGPAARNTVQRDTMR